MTDPQWIETATVEPEAATPTTTPPRRGLRSAIAAVASISIVGAALVTASVMGSGSGSGSPEAAVRGFMNALADGDVLGAFDKVAPAERESLRQPMIDTVNELKRVGVLNKQMDLRSLYRAELSDMQTTTTTLADDLAAVKVVGGTAVTHPTDPATLLGPRLADLIDSLADADKPEPKTTDLADEPVELATVKVDGNWYVSLWYSVGLAAVGGAANAPDPADAVAAKGAASPDGAVKAMLDAVTQPDVRRMIELLPPDEMRVLHDFAPRFLPDAEKAAAEARRDGYSAKVSNFASDTSINGSRATVTITSLTVEVQADGRTGRLEIRDGCLIAGYDGETVDSCAKGETWLKDGVTVHATRHNGQWYVSPVGTLAHQLVASLKALDDNLMDDVAEAVSGMLGALNGGLSAFGTDLDPGREVVVQVPTTVKR